MNFVLVIDKPAGPTSHDVVNRVRRILQERAVGHLGTLDPLATGVLPLVTGNLTRLAQFYTGCEKTYEGVIRLGFATDTYDSQGEPTTRVVEVQVSLEELRTALNKFIGVIEQAPPPFSAKKINGVPAYKLARRKQEVPLKPVQVEIKELDILGRAEDRVSFRARVASGTYLRSVAHDLGRELGCGGHLESLRRTSVGEFRLADAHTLEAIDSAMQAGRFEEVVIHPRKLLPEFPSVTANDEMAARIRTGRTVNLPDMSGSKRVKVFYGQGELICIANRVAGPLFHPTIVLSGNTTLQQAGPAQMR